MLRKFIAVLAVMAILWAALSHGSTADLWAIIVPILVLAGLLAVVSAHPPYEDPELLVFRFVPVLASRAPPSF
jgi:hypothetical protein